MLSSIKYIKMGWVCGGGGPYGEIGSNDDMNVMWRTLSSFSLDNIRLFDDAGGGPSYSKNDCTGSKSNTSTKKPIDDPRHKDVEILASGRWTLWKHC